MSEEDDGALIVELQGEVFKIQDFTLTFGDVMAAKSKARRSTRKGDEQKAHEVFWLVRRIFEKNDLDIDIKWLTDVPMHEMKYVLKKMDEQNPGFGPDRS